MKFRLQNILFSLFILSGLLFTACKPAEPLGSRNPGKNKGNGEKKAVSQAETKLDYLFVEANTYYLQGKNREAVGLFKQVLEIEPKHHASMYSLAKIYLETGENERAVEYAQKACELEKETIWYYKLLKDAYLSDRDYEGAIATQETIAQQFPDDPRSKYDLAQIYARQKQYRKSIEVYNQIENETGPNEEILVEKQQLYLMLDEPANALLEVDKLIQLFPDEPSHYLTKYELAIIGGDFDAAKATLDEMLEVFPRNGFALLAMAEYYDSQGDKAKSDEYLLKAFSSPGISMMEKVQIMGSLYTTKLQSKEGITQLRDLADQLVEDYPEEAIVYGILGDVMHEQGKAREAREQYRKSLEMDPSNESVWEELLFLDSELRDYEAMQEDADDAVELMPNNGIFLYFLGTANQQTGDLDAAVWAFKKILKQGSTNLQLIQQAHLSLAEIYNMQKEYALSDEQFAEVLSFNPSNDLALNNYAYYLSLRNERLDEAQEMVEKALKEDPESSAYLDTYGWILFQQGEFSAAEKQIKLAIDQGGQGEVYEHYGDVLLKLGKRNEAIEYFEKAIQTGQSELIIEDKLNTSKLDE